MKLNSDIMWSFYLTGTAILFFCFGNFLGSSQTEKDLAQKMEEKDQKIKLLNQENQQLSEELTSRGILSYPQAGIISGNQEENLSLLIMLNGQKPITNLIVKRKVIPSYSQMSQEEVKNAIPEKNSGNLGVLKPHTPASINIPMKEEEVAVIFNFKSGKKEWSQHLRAKRDPSGKIAAFWVITNGNKVVIDKHIDKNFPLEPDGSILFWKDKKVNYSEIEMNSTLDFKE